MRITKLNDYKNINTTTKQVKKIIHEMKDIYSKHSIKLELVEATLTKEDIAKLFRTAIKTKENTRLIGKLINLSTPMIQAISNKAAELAKLLKTSKPIDDADVTLKMMFDKIKTKTSDHTIIDSLGKYLKLGITKPEKSAFTLGVFNAALEILEEPSEKPILNHLITDLNKLIDAEPTNDIQVNTINTGVLAGQSFSEKSLDMVKQISDANQLDIETHRKEILSNTNEIFDNTISVKYPETINKFIERIEHVTLVGQLNDYAFNYDLYVDNDLMKKINTIITNLKNAVTEYDKYLSIAQLHEILNLIQNNTSHQSLLISLSSIYKQFGDITLTPEQEIVVKDMSKNIPQTINALSQSSSFFYDIIKNAIQSSKDNLTKSKEIKKSASTISEGILDGLIQKVSFEKLENDWINAGRPLDSEEIIKILTKYFSVDTVNNIFRSNYITFDKSESSDEKPINNETIDTIISKAEAENIDKDLLIDYIIVG